MSLAICKNFVLFRTRTPSGLASTFVRGPRRQLHMEVVHLNDPSKFDETIAAQLKVAKNSSKALFVLFSSSWCPDCKEGDPIVHEVLSERKNCILVECDVGDRAPYKSPDFVYRKHPQIKLTAIPTLLRWNESGADDRLVESQLFRKQNVVKFAH